MATTQNTSYHKKRLARRMKNSEFRDEYERAKREIDSIDSIIRQLDELREDHGWTKAELARLIGKDPAAIRRFFTAKGNPQLSLITAIADAVDAEVQVVPKRQRGTTRSRVTTRKAA